MGYKIEKVSMPVSMDAVREFEYALIYEISSMVFGRADQLKDIDWEECLEARFFSDDRELHVYDTDNGKEAVRILDDGTEEDICLKKYRLSEKFSGMGKNLVVQEYLSYDQDGQMAVALTRLKGIV